MTQVLGSLTSAAWALDSALASDFDLAYSRLLWVIRDEPVDETFPSPQLPLFSLSQINVLKKKKKKYTISIYNYNWIKILF